MGDIQKWKKVYLGGDIDKILTSYSEDGMMMSFDGIIAKGRDNNRASVNLNVRRNDELEA